MAPKRSWRICLASAFLLILGLGSAMAIQVAGLAPDQVLQRSADGSAKARLILRPLAAGAQGVRCRVTQASLALEDHDWTDAVRQADGQWLFELEALPTGGPYRIEIQARDSEGRPLETAAVDGILVGDLWVLAGQSNMEGVARLDGAEGPDALVHVFDMSDAWRIATEPLHERPLAVHPVYWNVREPAGAKRLLGEEARRWRARRATGAGLGLPFAKELVRTTSVPIGLIPCAYGGTSMDQWSPERKAEGSGSLYGAMLNRIASAGGRIKGILWYQGESDANRQASIPYAGKMERLIAAVRADLGQSRLPFYYVQIGRFVTDGENSADWDAVQEAQRRLDRRIEAVGVVASIDRELDDLIHVDTAGHKVLARRLAGLAGIDLFSDRPAYRGMLRGPRIESVSFDGSGRRRIRIRYSGVNGRLGSEGRVSGFSVSTPGEENPPQPFKVRVDPSAPDSVSIFFPRPLPEGAELWYGRGYDPYCNLVDEAGMAALAAGPLEIGAGEEK